MSDIRKDCFGQEITAGDIISYLPSKTSSALNTEVVIGFSPMKVRTPSGVVLPSLCVVVTDQLKRTNPQWVAKQLDDSSDRLNNKIPKVKTKVEFYAKIYTEQEPKDTLDKPHYLVIERWENRVLVENEDNYQFTKPHALRKRFDLILIGYFRRETYRDIINYGGTVPSTHKGSTWSKTGKLIVTQFPNRKGESLLHQNQVKALTLGFIPEKSKVLPFNSRNDLVDYLRETGMVENIQLAK